MANPIVWCDIPVRDLDRAVAFYSALLECEFEIREQEGARFAALPHEDGGGIGGSLFLPGSDTDSQPSRNGPLVYVNADGRLPMAVDAVRARGGEVLQPIHPIGPFGFRAIVIDSEGNRIALHSETV